MSEMKYNYVIFGSDWDLYRFAYKDVSKLDNVRYLGVPFGRYGKLLSFIHRIHKSQKVNRIINLPWKSIWNGSYFKNDFQKKAPICFILFTDWAFSVQDYGLIEYLKLHYLDSKFIWFLQDIVSSRQGKFNINLLKSKFDLIISFDPGDCSKYGFVYHPLVFSSCNFGVEKCAETDVYFLGKAKNRLTDILGIYEQLKDYGLRCNFHITEVSEQDKVFPDEIIYNQTMSYDENLQHIHHTRCVLEVMQKNGYGWTQRVCEIVGLNKKLLTNNPIIKDAPFYNSKYISVFNSPDGIDMEFISRLSIDEDVDYHYKEKISPVELLCFIDNLI